MVGNISPVSSSNESWIVTKTSAWRWIRCQLKMVVESHHGFYNKFTQRLFKPPRPKLHWQLEEICTTYFHVVSLKFYETESLIPWSSLVEGDKQTDRPNSQRCIEWSQALFLGVWHKRNSLLLGPLQSSSPTTKELHSWTLSISCTNTHPTCKRIDAKHTHSKTLNA